MPSAPPGGSSALPPVLLSSVGFPVAKLVSSVGERFMLAIENGTFIVDLPTEPTNLANFQQIVI